MHWRIKGITQKVLSVVPGGGRVNDMLQRTLGELGDFERHASSKVSDWCILVSHIKALGIRPGGLDYLEIGTGWFPTFPMCFSLVNAQTCKTYDLFRHLSRRLTSRMLARLQAHLPTIARAGTRAIDDVEADYAHMVAASSVQELLRRGRIEYRAPADATATELPDESVDVVFSNSVLEHVPCETISRMMLETRRVLRSGGLAIHSVNCGDHYAYFDKRITPINYLQFPERSWRFWNNRLLYQNRLRPQDFVAQAETAGLHVVLTRYRPRPELLAALPTIELAPEFRGYSREQLCSTSLDFAAVKR